MEDIENLTDEYDKEFISLMLTIEKKSEILNKYDKLRIKNWCKKLCQITNNVEWKKNRNLHAICILDSVLNEHFEEPYNKFPPEGSVPILNKTLVKSKLSKKFFEEALKMHNVGNNNENEENEENNENGNYNENAENQINSNMVINEENDEIISEQKKEIERLNNALKEKDSKINNLIKEKNEMKEYINKLEQKIKELMKMENQE